MNWLYPRFPLKQLACMVRIALLGTIIATVYGAAHDQVSYTLAPEYFTKLKFRQFAWADVGWPPRLFASVIGALASWWVGLIAGWLLARSGLAEMPATERSRRTWRAFGIVFVVTALAGAIGWGLGVRVASSDLTSWANWQQTLKLDDLPSFVVVAYLHYCSYFGALAGLVVAVVDLLRYVRRKREQESKV